MNRVISQGTAAHYSPFAMTSPEHSHDEATIDPTEPSERLRLIGCRLAKLPGAHVSVTVEFSLPGESGRMSRSAEATSSPTGDLRLPALATIDAIAAATSGAFTADLLGAKLVRAFDANIMVVALNAVIDGQPRRLVGVAIADQDHLRSVVLATLQAVNRLVSPLLLRAMSQD